MALTAIHPGEHLAEELEALDRSAAELARKIDVPTNRVTPSGKEISPKLEGRQYLRTRL
jgi:plasmid maintenance system antidote protein VapI